MKKYTLENVGLFATPENIEEFMAGLTSEEMIAVMMFNNWIHENYERIEKKEN